MRPRAGSSSCRPRAARREGRARGRRRSRTSTRLGRGCSSAMRRGEKAVLAQRRRLDGRRRAASTSSPTNAIADRAVAGREVGGVRGALPRVHHAASRPRDARWPCARRRRRSRWRRCRATRASSCTGRATAGALHWALGPELYTRDLTKTFAFVDGAPEKLPDAAGDGGVDIGFTRRRDVPTGAVALVGARIITMSTGATRSSRTARWSCAATASWRWARGRGDGAGGREGIDVSGKTHHAGHRRRALAPAAMGTTASSRKQNWPLHGQPGVRRDDGRTIRPTTPRPCSRRSEMVRAGRRWSGRASSRPARSSTAPRRRSRRSSRSIEDARSHLRRMKAVGAFSVKSYNQPRRDAAAEDHQGRARAGDDGGAGGRLAALAQHDDGGGRPHRHRALPAGAARSTRTSARCSRRAAVGYTPTLIVAYGGAVRRELLVPARRRVGRTSGC